MNIVILIGRLAGDPTARELAGRASVWSFDLVTREAPTGESSGARRDVPIVWEATEVPGWLSAGQEVVVVGVVRRRFFRAGGATQSRTEVVASAVTDITRRRSAARALERLVVALGADERTALRSLAS